MNEQIKQKLATSLASFRLPRYEELPDMGLYLDQVVRYVNRYTSLLGSYEITPSMVNNYTKQKIIPGPNKKFYGAPSIAYLIFIAYTKMVVPMDDIRFMIDIQHNSYSISVAYDYFCAEFENLLQFTYGLKAEPEYVGGHNTSQKQLLRSALLSITHKMYLENTIRLLRESMGEDVQPS